MKHTDNETTRDSLIENANSIARRDNAGAVQASLLTAAGLFAIAGALDRLTAALTKEPKT